MSGTGPWILVLMGVTATGKTTIAQELVKQTGWLFAEGDDYHSKENVAKLHAGIPLTDEDRAPWLQSLHGVLAEWQGKGESGVMTCSALKESYRETLRAGMDAQHFRFVLLEVPEDVLRERLKHRTGHYMNPSLLQSQISTLEEPDDAMKIDANRPQAEVAADILRQLGVS
jgi:gluconokinase